jgi:hypothetical protein
MDSYIGIIRAFSRDLASEHTIRQVSKLIKKSYAYTNKKCRELISQGVLLKKVVGASILCKLNFENDITITLLSLNSALEKREKISGKKKQDAEELQNSLSKAVDVILLKENKFYIVAKDHLECNDKLSLLDIDAVVLSEDQFNQMVKNDFEKLILIYGFENFWRLMYNVK